MTLETLATGVQLVLRVTPDRQVRLATPDTPDTPETLVTGVQLVLRVTPDRPVRGVKPVRQVLGARLARLANQLTIRIEYLSQPLVRRVERLVTTQSSVQLQATELDDYSKEQMCQCRKRCLRSVLSQRVVSLLIC